MIITTCHWWRKITQFILSSHFTQKCTNYDCIIYNQMSWMIHPQVGDAGPLSHSLSYEMVVHWSILNNSCFNFNILIYIYIYAPPCLACLYKMLIMKYWLSFDDHHNLSLMEKNYTVYPTPSSHSEVHKLWLQHLKSDEFVTSASRRWGASKA